MHRFLKFLVVDGLAHFNTLVAVVPVHELSMHGNVWLTSVTKKHLLFSLQACRNAHIALSELYGTEPYDVYEVRVCTRYE